VGWGGEGVGGREVEGWLGGCRGGGRRGVVRLLRLGEWRGWMFGLLCASFRLLW
jgi:hypothetical protein